MRTLLQRVFQEFALLLDVLGGRQHVLQRDEEIFAALGRQISRGNEGVDCSVDLVLLHFNSPDSAARTSSSRLMYFRFPTITVFSQPSLIARRITVSPHGGLNAADAVRGL